MRGGEKGIFSPMHMILNKTSLIIWDEAPMANKFCFEALDKTLRDIRRVRYEIALTNLLEALQSYMVVIFAKYYLLFQRVLKLILLMHH